VPRGTQRPRLTPSPLHSDNNIDALVAALADMWQRLTRRRAARLWCVIPQGAGPALFRQFHVADIPELHRRVAIAAARSGKSVNTFVAETSEWSA